MPRQSSGSASGQYLRAAVCGVQFRGFLHGLGAQFGVLRGGQANAEFQQHQLASRIGGQLQSVKAARLANQLCLPRHHPVFGLGKQGYGVVSNVGFFHPLGAGDIDLDAVQLLLGAVDEGERLGHGGLRGRGILRRGIGDE